MEISKQNGNICFNEEAHAYWDVTNGRKAISCTQLIEHYTQPFNEEFWSLYKALEKSMNKNIFKVEKGKLLETKNIDLSYFVNAYNLKEVDVRLIQQEILAEWKENNKLSTERGSKIHSQIENSFYKYPTCKLEKYGLGGSFNCQKDYYELTYDKGVYPEYLIYYQDPEILLAGQIDLLIKDGNEIHIKDWKSNKEIKQQSYYNSKTKKSDMMKYPLNTLMDCNYYHYTMQLSIYAWMIQKLNPEFVIKDLELVHFDHSGNITHYDIDYKKHEVELMINDYKKQLRQNEQRNRRSRFDY